MTISAANLLADIATVARVDCSVHTMSRVGGGDINDSFYLAGADGPDYFLKLNAAEFAENFAAEAAGLRELADAGAVRVPQALGHGVAGQQAWLLLEALALRRPDDRAAEQMGHGLAALHRVTAKHFGWQRDNVIGSTPQSNTQHDDWISFWRDERLLPQLRMAGMEREGETLVNRLDNFFSAYRPVPSLLHGDLWGGNWAALDDSTPVMFDPAVYYGDRETDLAMTALFGGFSEAFYAAYNEAWPLDDGFAVRQDFYNLYHVLNHYNLFGGGYRAQAEALIERLTAI